MSPDTPRRPLRLAPPPEGACSFEPGAGVLHGRGVTSVVLGLLLVLALALVIIAAVALPHLREGRPVLTDRGEELTRRVARGAEAVGRAAAEVVPAVVRPSSGAAAPSAPPPPTPAPPATRPSTQPPAAAAVPAVRPTGKGTATGKGTGPGKGTARPAGAPAKGTASAARKGGKGSGAKGRPAKGGAPGAVRR